VASRRTEVFKECLRIPLLDRLKTKKDDKGNTPFHLTKFFLDIKKYLDIANVYFSGKEI
jgi:hypothetical protein